MITLKLEKKKYYIPNNLREMILKDYQKIKSLKKREDNTKVIYDILNVYGMQKKDIDKLSYRDIKDISNSMTLMLNTSSNKVDEIIKLGDYYFKFEEDLKNMRFDQFIDLNEYTKEEEKMNDNLHIIMSLLYRRVLKVKKSRNIIKAKRKIKYITEEYDSSKVLEYAELFKEMNMENVYGVVFFFINLKVKLLKTSVGSLINQMEI